MVVRLGDDDYFYYKSFLKSELTKNKKSDTFEGDVRVLYRQQYYICYVTVEVFCYVIDTYLKAFF